METTTNNQNVATGFSKQKRKMILALGRTDNENGEFYNVRNVDASKSAKKLKSLTSGPHRLINVPSRKAMGLLADINLNNK